MHVWCRSLWSVTAALRCIRKALENVEKIAKPKVILVSDNPSFIMTLKASVQELAEVYINKELPHVLLFLILNFFVSA